MPGVSDGRLWATAELVLPIGTILLRFDALVQMCLRFLILRKTSSLYSGPHPNPCASLPLRSCNSTRSKVRPILIFRVGIHFPGVIVPITEPFLGSLLAVRTMGYASITSLRYRLGLDSLPNITAKEVTRINHTETGGRPIVDVRMFDTISGPAVLAINDEGTVFQSSVMSNTQTMYVGHLARSPVLKKPTDILSTNLLR